MFPFPPFLILARYRRMLGAATRNTIFTLVVSAGALVGIANFEAFRSVAYRDSAGIATIGYGETAGVKMGDTITPERALVRLAQSADAHARGIQKCITAPLFQYEFDAYLSLAYNIGVAGFCNSSVPTLINADRYDEACDRILAFDKAYNPKTGRREALRGLTTRRQAERLICLGAS